LVRSKKSVSHHEFVSLDTIITRGESLLVWGKRRSFSIEQRNVPTTTLERRIESRLPRFFWKNLSSSHTSMDSFEDNLAALSSTEPDLQSSAMTGSGSDNDSVSNGTTGGWLSDFRSIAMSLQKTAGGVANFVHRSAVAIADEIAQLEQEEMEKQHHDSSTFDENACEGGGIKVLPLPWELSPVNKEESSTEDLQLKDKIQELAEYDGVFLGPYTTKRDEDSEFLDEARIALIRRLLEIDEQLAQTHARLSGRSDVRETLFWKNYFYHVEQAKASHAVMTTSLDSLVPADDDDEEQEEAGEDGDDEWEKDSAAFVQIPTPPTSTNSLGVHSVDSMVVIDGPTPRATHAP